MEDNKKLQQDMIKALQEDKLPPKEALPYLYEFFNTFEPELQDLLVDKGVVKKQRCEVWSRVMGYFRPVDQWNNGKKQEHSERHHLTAFQVDKEIKR